MYKAQILLLTFFLSFTVKNTFAQEHNSPDGIQWVSFEDALALSTKEPKKIFLDIYTGWCGWCKKLQADVFAKPEFISWASKNVVLLELDFPRNKQLSPELTQQNQNLQQTFQIAGYPTIWMFNLDKPDTSSKFNIDAIGSLGYPQGAELGKEQVKFLSDANRLMDANKNGTK